MFTLIDLPYSSLSPVIGDETLSFHYGKHLQTYVDNLNKLVVGTGFEGMELTDVILASAAGTAGLVEGERPGAVGLCHRRLLVAISPRFSIMPGKS